PAAAVLAGLVLFVMFLWWMDRRFEGRRFYATALLTGPLILAISWFLMREFNTWVPFPPFWAALVVVLPGLEVGKMLRVNRDLDGKIQRLSSGWLAALNWYEPEWPESAAASRRRAQLFARKGLNSRWKLHAIDFLNEELMRFLSFNNAILASIEDVIVVCDAE